jgi:hypothetical protein
VADNFSSNIREEELIKVCEGRQLKAKQDGKLARLEEQEKQAISSNTLRITKPRGREDASEDSSSTSVHKEAKKSSYGKNYRPLVLAEQIVKTGDKVQLDNENKKREKNTDSNKRKNSEVVDKKSKKNKKRKRSDSAEEQIQPEERQNDNKESRTKKNDKHNKTVVSTNQGFFFFNYDDENKKIEQSPSSGPRASSMDEVRADSTARSSKSAKRRANKKQRTS